MPPTLKTAALATGVRLPYAEQGDPGGTPVLMLHGATDSWRSFEPILPFLPGSLRALALTQRGHGDAERPESGYEIADLTADAVAFLDALEIDRAVVVGHSMGTWVAESIAASQPDRVAGLVLAGAPGPAAANPAIDGFMAEVAALEDPVPREFAHEFQVSTLERPIAASRLDGFVDESMKLPARVWRALFAGFGRCDLSRDWARIDAPTLLVWGDRDGFVTRAEQDALEAGIRGATLRVYEGTGHAVHWEEPQRFAADVAALAARASAARAEAA